MGKQLSTDKLLFYTVISLVAFGVVMVYSASSVIAPQGKYGVGPNYFGMHQLFWAAISIVLLMLFKRMDYRNLKSPTWAFGGIGMVGVMLLASYFLDSGKHRWLDFGVARLQPSEFAKPALVLFLAYHLTRRIRAVNDWRYTLGGALLVLGPLIIGVAAADLGTAVVLLVTAGIAFIVAGLGRIPLLCAAGIIVVFMISAILMKPYRVGRVIASIDPQHEFLNRVDPGGLVLTYVRSSTAPSDPGFQALQSKIAIGSGGLTGLGLMDGKQKLFYIPEAHTDFIFAVIGEEFGLAGTASLVLGFFVILWRGYRVFLTAPDDFGRYLALGITTMIVFQALFNVTVVLGMGPTKGIPLPMISYGGSSLLATLMSVGLLLSVSERSS